MLKCRGGYSLLSGLFLLSSLCESMASPIPNIDDAYFQGTNTFENVDPRTACRIFNQKVTLINEAIKEKYPDLEEMEFSKNFCQAIRVNEMQDEATFETMHRTFMALPVSVLAAVSNTYDLARTTDILIFSGSGKTDYVMMVNGDINLAKQNLFGQEYYASEVAPTVLSQYVFSGVDDLSGHDVGPFFHNTEITNLIVDASVYDSSK
ncbi:hypothetical protein [Aeromonas schubertii]|uniref:hypothetical protein n=1 Tax=Aeromonas schubertii TaxID=652 RepID=UPI0010A914AD|nr:hypothetical protein [Aeromonas schubertii]QCG47276.1 hypothetical protein E2P79_04895 [Aeromonas schubertii]